MLSEKMEKILNEQLAKEGYSSDIYLAMASWAEVNGFAGIAKWLYAQSEEERVHMLKFLAYINDRGGHAIVPASEQPPKNYETIQKLFEKVLEHEKYISAAINEIVGKCIELKDYTTHTWIQWFVNEQIEEEAQVKNILDKLALSHDMYIFDRDIMGMRSEDE
ncbi:MAG: ferritin [Bacteroidetes bacterium]|jgi:ferritin|nr:ferritin [Bacteroidota bacterium]